MKIDLLSFAMKARKDILDVSTACLSSLNRDLEIQERWKETRSQCGLNVTIVHRAEKKYIKFLPEQIICLTILIVIYGNRL